MRPSGETAVASAITRPAPPAARAPRCTRCQSVARPSSEEYMHIGETPMRLRSVTDFSVNGSKRCGIAATKGAARHFAIRGLRKQRLVLFVSLDEHADV